MPSLQGMVAVDFGAADVGALGVRWPELCMCMLDGESSSADTTERVDLEQMLFQ